MTNRLAGRIARVELRLGTDGHDLQERFFADWQSILDTALRGAARRAADGTRGDWELLRQLQEAAAAEIHSLSSEPESASDRPLRTHPGRRRGVSREQMYRGLSFIYTLDSIESGTQPVVEAVVRGVARVTSAEVAEQVQSELAEGVHRIAEATRARGPF